MNKTDTFEKDWKQELEDKAVTRKPHGGWELTNVQLNEIEDFISSLLAKQRQAVLEEVREKVIGEDDMYYGVVNPGSTLNRSREIRNQLKNEQRTRLEKMEKEV